MDFNVVSAYSILAPTLVGAFLLIVSRLSFNMRIIVGYIFSTCILEFVARTLYGLKVNNMFILHIHAYVEFYFLIFLYHRLMFRIISRQIVRVFAVLFFVLSALFYFQNSILEFNAWQRHTEILMLMFIMMVYIYELMLFDTSTGIRRNTFFWFTASYMIYFGGTLLLFLSQERLLQQGATNYWVIHGIFNIFLNIVLTFVLWHGREKSLS